MIPNVAWRKWISWVSGIGLVLLLMWAIIHNVGKHSEDGGNTESLTFFVHCTNEVAIVAGPGKDTHDMSKLAFGSTLIYDNDVTEGPDLASKLIGRREGMAIMDNFAGENFYLLFTVIFEHHPKYQGTLQVQGTEIGHGDREISVVGGTGDFRGARGYSTFHLYTATPYPIIEQSFVLYKDSFNYKRSVDEKHIDQTAHVVTQATI
ncbi:protein MpDIR30 [Marchantia polymorpha subsp. ruderalis]|uniref:Dirigent protein n=2 Tax=Marchantia polymorpha TaxID=3197 RepID=A0AAF6BV38_MARPO|nr:hypothetical protein MARPO_0099s0036 [Marchantia polymorpha]BBN15872.1 hypothetical protein Mp_7g01630 [Marchantia polymorpha subsp. ruderalis]|eukprot:PTQ32400.1 hypothetical protein MARPO_0099s0036 [Marchantia polymorpha]